MIENEIEVYVEQISLSSKYKGLHKKNILKIAKSDLKVAQESIRRHIQFDFPIILNYKINIILKYSISSMKVKLDFSLIKNKRHARLIKLYLEDSKEFERIYYAQ